MFHDIDELINTATSLITNEVVPFMDGLNQTQLVLQSMSLVKQTNQLLSYTLQLFWPAVYVAGILVILLIISLIICTVAFLVAVIKYIATKQRDDSIPRDRIILHKWEPHQQSTES